MLTMFKVSQQLIIVLSCHVSCAHDIISTAGMMQCSHPQQPSTLHTSSLFTRPAHRALQL